MLSRVHAAVEAADLDHAEQLHELLQTVLAEIEVLDHLATWPWSTATIRGFTSALLLPVVIFLITQFIDRLL